MSNLIDVKEKLTGLLEELVLIVLNELKSDGLKCEDSQQICLINAISDLDLVINGISQNDLVEG